MLTGRAANTNGPRSPPKRLHTVARPPAAVGLVVIHSEAHVVALSVSAAIDSAAAQQECEWPGHDGDRRASKKMMRPIGLTVCSILHLTH